MATAQPSAHTHTLCFCGHALVEVVLNNRLKLTLLWEWVRDSKLLLVKHDDILCHLQSIVGVVKNHWV